MSDQTVAAYNTVADEIYGCESIDRERKEETRFEDEWFLFDPKINMITYSDDYSSVKFRLLNFIQTN